MKLNKLLIIAGPCLLQDEKDIELARKLKDTGADIFRAKVFMGEGTHPPDKNAFPLLDDEGYVEIFDAIASDVMDIATEANEFYFNYYELFDYVWTPARQMQNYKMLKELDVNCKIPIILKRGFGNTIDEIIGATEYLKTKTKDLYICERGINTFDRREDSRWTPDFRGMLELKQAGFKVIFDASHSIGRSEWIIPMAKAALALGINGIMMEVRENPEESWSDKKQCVSLMEFKGFMREIGRL